MLIFRLNFPLHNLLVQNFQMSKRYDLISPRHRSSQPNIMPT